MKDALRLRRRGLQGKEIAVQLTASITSSSLPAASTPAVRSAPDTPD